MASPSDVAVREAVAASAFWRAYPGSPEGKLDAPMHARCTDTVAGTIYRKTTAEGTKTGWVAGVG